MTRYHVARLNDHDSASRPVYAAGTVGDGKPRRSDENRGGHHAYLRQANGMSDEKITELRGSGNVDACRRLSSLVFADEVSRHQRKQKQDEEWPQNVIEYRLLHSVCRQSSRQMPSPNAEPS